MPQKTLNLALALIGACIVTVLLLLGIDAWRSAGAGPKWKRRLVAAGLALLATLGVPGCGEGDDGATGGSSEIGCYTPISLETMQRVAFRKTTEWTQLLLTWREAEEVASGKRGAYPFDKAGKRALLNAIQEAGRGLDTLASTEKLNETEVKLLQLELARLTEGVQAKRPTEMKMATCYEPMVMRPAHDSMKRLEARLPLLRSLAASRSFKPEVAAKALTTIEKDIATLSDEKKTAGLSEQERVQAAALGAEAAQILQSLKPLGPQSELQRSEDWQTVSATWTFASPLATSRKSTTAQRKELDERLKASQASLERLVRMGLLAAEEATLLIAETANIRSDVLRDPPTDSKVTCYDMAYTPPAQLSYARLTQRLPLIQKLIAGGKVHPAACSKILAAVKADLAILENKELTKGFKGAEAAKLAELKKKVTEAVGKIQESIDPAAAPALSSPPKESSHIQERLERLADLEALGKIRPEVAELARRAMTRG